MVEPAAGGVNAVPRATPEYRADHVRHQAVQDARARADRAAQDIEQQALAAAPERPPEPAAPLPRQASQPVPAEDLGTNIDLIA